MGSILFQGTTIALMAKWLRVNVPEKVKRRFPLDIEVKDNFNSELVELNVLPNSLAIGKAVFQLDFSKSALIVLIHRNGKYLTANGETII